MQLIRLVEGFQKSFSYPQAQKIKRKKQYSFGAFLCYFSVLSFWIFCISLRSSSHNTSASDLPLCTQSIELALDAGVPRWYRTFGDRRDDDAADLARAGEGWLVGSSHVGIDDA
jgi:hypothetical protein